MRVVMGRRTLHTGVDERYKLGLHVGHKYIGVCLFDRTDSIVVPDWPPFYRKDRKPLSIAKQLENSMNRFEVSKEIVVGRHPWSLSSKKQVKCDLTSGVTDIEDFIDEVFQAGVNANILTGVKFIFHDVRVILNPWAARERIKYLKNKGKIDFSGDEEVLLEAVNDTNATLLMMLHHLHMGGVKTYGEVTMKIEKNGDVTYSFGKVYLGTVIP
ncbi:hypothetical protein LWI28_008543 [Acer negundo]|uniref:Uncharacterized protein n=1 Tax=Acer negundo TaxID=4023 RepID=A0AAD5IQY3_ACENE|nr:hypothetical protein LWI28_008543 [Acer negundo]KAK4843144.1 hypothetical protein QYF36_004529 [Acer negundo]